MTDFERLLDAQQAERRRIADALHDDPVQILSVAVMRLDLLASELSEPGSVELLQQARSTVREAIDHLRTLMFTLHPPALEREGLASAITDLTGIDVDAHLSAEPPLGTAAVIFQAVHAIGGKPSAIALREVDGTIEVVVDHDTEPTDTTVAREFVESAGGSWQSTASRTRFTLPYVRLST